MHHDLLFWWRGHMFDCCMRRLWRPRARRARARARPCEAAPADDANKQMQRRQPENTLMFGYLCRLLPICS